MTNDYINGRKVVEGKELSLDEWLERIDDRTLAVVPDIAFPTDAMRDEYLRTVEIRDRVQVVSLVRRFLIPTCTPEYDEMFTKPRSNDPTAVITEQHRRMMRSEPAWEGLTWVIDLLEFSPLKAIAVLDAYIETHFQVLDRGWWLQRLFDAIALIRASGSQPSIPRRFSSDLADGVSMRLLQISSARWDIKLHWQRK